MTHLRNSLVFASCFLLPGLPALAQAATEDIKETASELAETAKQKIEGVAEQVDQTQQARDVSAGILKPIYLLAERISFPAFHWVAFTCMVAGVISFGLQLILGKLVVLTGFAPLTVVYLNFWKRGAPRHSPPRIKTLSIAASRVGMIA